MSLTDIPSIMLIEQAVQFSPWTERMFIDSLQHHDLGWVLMESLSARSTDAIDPMDKPRYSQICGYILVKPSFRQEITLDSHANPRNDHHADILTLAVDKNYQRKGCAQALITFVLSQFKTLYLEVRLSNQPAINLYEKMGFQVIGRRPRYYQGEDALVMKK